MATNGLNVNTDVPRDIINALRSPLPTPGCYEMPHVGIDAGVMQRISPTGTLCPGTYPLKVSVLNNGGVNIT